MDRPRVNLNNLRYILWISGLSGQFINPKFQSSIKMSIE